MDISTSISKFLKKPFPLEESQSIFIRNLLIISTFIFLFLYIFKPFGASDESTNWLLVSLGFGALTFISTILYNYVICPFLNIVPKAESFTFGKWISHMASSLVVIAIANFIYIRFIYFGYVDWRFFHHMLFDTLAIGLFPIIAVGTIALLTQEKKHQNIAAEINVHQFDNREDPREYKTLIGSIEIAVDKICYVESIQNYVKVGHLDSDDNLLIDTYRCTLKTIAEEANGTSLVKCHRSYLVNKDYITSSEGNAQGLILTLKYGTKLIPVSRSFVDQFRY